MLVEIINSGKQMNLKNKIVKRLSVAIDAQLDISFYKESYADLQSLSAKQLQHHWAINGKKEGRYPNLKKMLEANGIESVEEFDFDLDLDFYLNYYTDLQVAGIKTLQQAKIHWLLNGKKEGRFKTINDWIKTNGNAQYCNIEDFDFPKIISLNKTISIEVADICNIALGILKYPINVFEDQGKNYDFYYQLGINCYLQCKKTNCLDALSAARSFWRVALYFKLKSEALEQIGNTYLDELDYVTAQSVYEEAIDLTNKPTIHLINNLLLCYEKNSCLEKSLGFLVKLKSEYPDFTYIEELLDVFSEKFFLSQQGATKVLATQNKRKQLKEAVKEYSNVIYDSYYKLYSGDPIPKLKNLNVDKILIVGDYHVPQCIRYRLDQKVEQLELQGKEVTTIDWTKLQEHQNEIAFHDIVIFYRVPVVVNVLKAMAQVNANGKASFYEIDDLLFEESYPAPINTFGGYINLDVHIELRKSMAMFYAAIQFCRYGISSTKLLCDKLESLVLDKKCILHRNGLDKENIIRQLDKTRKNTVDIFYGSGTQAHNSDFIDQALPALERILSKYQHVRLVIAGYLQLPSAFTKKYESQLQQLPAVKSVKAYWSFLEQADINLAVLNDDDINGCKSELKWFEAACFSIPSIVSSTANYRDVLTSGVDAYIVANEAEWFVALEELIIKPELREVIATKALTKVKSEYSVNYLGKQLVNNIGSLLGSKRPKKKIALINVFFPPQAIGGATRVVSDNFDILQQQYGDDFELVVFTSDDRCTEPYQLTTYQHQGVTVYRSTILYRENMDWHPKDKNMYDLFEQFLELEKPDMVHFHCVQRLTASVVEATKDNKIPYIITAHDAWWISDHQFLIDKNDKVYPDGHPDMFATRVLPNNVTLGDSIERITYYQELLKGATHLLTVSESFAEIYRRNGYPEIKVNKNGISSTVEWLPKETSYTDKIVCALIGGMANHKGYFLLKESIEQEQPDNIEMLIVDHSKEDGYVHKTQWGKVPVTFIGRVNQNGITALYQKIDVLFAPSMWPESYGLVTREAAACGCWVVASELGGIGEDIIEGKTGFKVKPELNSLCKAIKKIDANTKKFKQNIKQADIGMVDKQVEDLASKFYV